MKVYEHNNKFVVADYNHGTYLASMKKSARKLTGCHSVFSKNLEEMFWNPNVQKYGSKAAANKALKKLTGE